MGIVKRAPFARARLDIPERNHVTSIVTQSDRDGRTPVARIGGAVNRDPARTTGITEIRKLKEELPCQPAKVSCQTFTIGVDHERAGRHECRRIKQDPVAKRLGIGDQRERVAYSGTIRLRRLTRKRPEVRDITLNVPGSATGALGRVVEKRCGSRPAHYRGIRLTSC